MNQPGRRRQFLFSLILCLLLFIPLALTFAPAIRAGRAQREGDKAAQEGDFSQAAASLAVAAAFQPERAALWEAAGEYALAAEDPHTAIHYLQRAAAQGEMTKDALMTLAEAYEAIQDRPNANLAWEAANQLDPADTKALERLLQNYREAGDLAAIQSVLRRLIAQQPNNADHFLQLGLITAVLVPEASLAYLGEAAAIDPNLAEISNHLEGAIRRAQLIDDDPAYLAVAVGRALASQGEWELAQVSFMSATQLRPEFADAWAFLGEANQQLGGTGGAALQEAYRLDPNSLVVNTLFALFWQREGRYDLAVEHLSVSLTLDPGNPLLIAEMGATMSAMGDVQTAISLFSEAVEQNPENPVYWQFLAKFSIQSEIQVEELGLPAARQAHASRARRRSASWS